MSQSIHDALVTIMVVTASSADGISEHELVQIAGLIRRSPSLKGFEESRLTEVANAAIDRLNEGGLEAAVDAAVAAIPGRLHDTAYALAVEVAVVDRDLPQEELRFLEMLRDRLLGTDRLVTAAIEASARARMRKL
ncbi:tellurite resistance TerB family protein [Devosia sp.]|uniref:tellurite resistance TerB family protein n=1 Tax=Devosia sp. TaxID=1871048 RepID=UPI003A95AA69